MTKKQMRQTIIDRYFFNRQMYDFQRYKEKDLKRADAYLERAIEIEQLFYDLFNESLFDMWLASDEYYTFKN